MNNEYIREVLEVLEREAGSFREMIEAKDRPKFVSDFLASREHFGNEVTDANKLFVEVVKFIADSKAKVRS